MIEKRFHREEYPFDILGEFGLTEEMIYDLPDFVHDKIEMGGLSPLLPIAIKQPFGFTHCYARFCLVEGPFCAEVLFLPKLKEVDLSKFNEHDKQLLLSGKAIVADITEGDETIKAFVQIDKATNNVVYTPTQIIGRNLQTICSEFELSGDDMQGFWTGGLVTVEVPDSKGTPTIVTIGVDLLSERGVEIVPGDAHRWEKVVRQPIPEYSFGSDGCWMNRNVVLSYVPDDEFTQDILDAMERNAHANGIPVEELRENEQRPYHQESNLSEEARQLTR